MKYTLLAAALLSLVLAFCVTNTLVVDSICTNISESIENAESEMERSGNSSSLCREISVMWEKRSNYISVVSHHEAAEETETEIKSMCAAAEKGNREDFFLHSARAKSLLEHIGGEEKLRFSNIF